MKDTHPIIEKEFDQRLSSLTPEKRMEIGAKMFQVTKEIILASLSNKADEKEIKVELFNRLYGDEFSERERENIIRCLRGS